MLDNFGLVQNRSVFLSITEIRIKYWILFSLEKIQPKDVMKHEVALMIS